MCELQVIWVKYDLGGVLKKYLGGLGVLLNVLVHVGCEPLGSKVLRHLPRCRSTVRDLVAEIDRWTATHTI